MKTNLMRFVGAGALAFVFSLGAATMQAAPLAGFGQGYGPGYGQGPGPGGWDQPPGSYRNDVMRQGYRDGIEGARKDVGNHRRPNVNNRDEYRHPNVPGPARRDYRRGFREGYQNAMAHMAGGGGPRPY